MPEPDTQVDLGLQVEKSADTPQIPADKQTTQKTTESVPSDKGLMDFLDIPPEVQKRLAPKAEEPKAEAEPEPEFQGPPIEEPGKNEEPEELAPDEEEAEEEESPATAEQKPDKRQKRINRLTRQKYELEAQLDKFAAENHRLRQLSQDQHTQRGDMVGPPSLVGGDLPNINQAIKSKDDILAWCDRNSEGGQLGTGDKAQFIDAQGVRDWRRQAEGERQELVVKKDKAQDKLQVLRDQSDNDAYALLPEMFDSTKKEYQEAVAIYQQYPFLTALPEANLAVAQVLEGRRVLLAKKAAKNGQKPVTQHRDLDERVFSTPRVPIAPHTSEPPTRESKPSSKKLEQEAMSRLINDPDGGVENLAKALAARDNAQKSQPSSRSPVRS